MEARATFWNRQINGNLCQIETDDRSDIVMVVVKLTNGTELTIHEAYREGGIVIVADSKTQRLAVLPEEEDTAESR